MKYYDLIVVGLGVMGAAATWQASKATKSVLAIEVGGPTHRNGSSHGATRIYRQAYWEGNAYLEMLRLADEGWKELELQSRKTLLIPTGGIFIGPKSSGVVAGSLATAQFGNIPHEYLAANDIRRRFPQFSVLPNMEAVFEPGAYSILAEESRLQMLNEAVSNGAHLVYGMHICGITEINGRPAIKTSMGETVVAGAVIICTGAWGCDMLPELRAVIQPHRVPIYWFEPRAGYELSFSNRSFPVFLYEEDQGALLYGIPSGLSSERGVKIGFHNRQLVPSDPNKNPPNINDFKLEIAAYIERIFPGLDPAPRDSKWCFYTMTADQSFIIDQSAYHPHTFFVSACSGHGFKFGPAIGKILTELGLGLPLSADIAHFSISRFQNCRAGASI